MPDWLILGLLAVAGSVAIGFVVIRVQRWVQQWIVRGDAREIRRRLATESVEALLAETDAQIAELRERFAAVDEHAGQASALGNAVGPDILNHINRDLVRRLAYRESIIRIARETSKR